MSAFLPSLSQDGDQASAVLGILAMNLHQGQLGERDDFLLLAATAECRKESSQVYKCAILRRTGHGKAICSCSPGVEDGDSYVSGSSVYEGE